MPLCFSPLSDRISREVIALKRDYNREFEELTASFGGLRPRLLLHVCCAPCASSVLERVYPCFDVTLFYYNPNIHPEEENKKRAGEIPKLLRGAGMEDVAVIYADYDPGDFFAAARGLEAEPEGGARCEKCFDLRLSATADFAARNGFDYFGTTLTVSPHKNAPLINEIGERLAREYGIPWLPSDFKKRDGYLRSIRLCQRYGIYRQCWCGCVFSAN